MEDYQANCLQAGQGRMHGEGGATRREDQGILGG